MKLGKERTLPVLDKSKFLVPGHVTVTELIRVLRRRLQLAPGQAFFLLSERGMPPGTQTLSELWESDKDEGMSQENFRIILNYIRQ